MEIKETQKNAKKRLHFYCENCDFICSNKFDYKRHLSTQKHKVSVDGNKMELLEIADYANFKYKCVCNKQFKTGSGLWKHKQKCNLVSIDTEPNQPISNELIVSILQQNKELQQLMMDQNKSLIEISKNNQITNYHSIHTNSHNKTFNLQVFLNETCKDAMNLTEFVDSLQIQLSDLEKVGKDGFVAGISNIIMKNLKALDVTMRPVHCSDQKRETMYIKDQNEWHNDSKELPENQKLKKAIKQIAHKNICMIPEWKKQYPDCVYADSRKSDLYNHIMYEAMDHNEVNSDKIIKKIAKEVGIEKNN
jgi:hypothetical protein